MRKRIAVLVVGVLIAVAWAFQRPQPDVTPQTPAASTAAVAKLVGTPRATPALSGEAFLRIEETAEGFAPRMELPRVDAASRWKNPAKPVAPSFPKNFADAVRVQSGVADVQARPVNGRVSSGKIVSDGSLVYADAFEGCDVSYRCTALKTEEFLTVKDANAPTQWSWELDTHGLKARLTPASTIELCDADGVPRLRINAPDGKDAKGKLLLVGERLALRLDGSRVTLAAKLEGCAFPVVIDPTWSSTGSLAFARSRHSATLLKNGNVLVVGGQQGFSSSLPTCELYDPSIETWRMTSSLPISRHYHAAVLLTNGKVLIAGGSNFTPPGTAVDT